MQSPLNLHIHMNKGPGSTKTGKMTVAIKLPLRCLLRYAEIAAISNATVKITMNYYSSFITSPHTFSLRLRIIMSLLAEFRLSAA